MAKVGRPSKYDPKMNEQVYKLCLLGAIDREIANFFDVNEATINRWKESEPEFCKSLKKGKIEADVKAAESLYKRALGYEYDEITYEKNQTGGLGIKINQTGIDEIKAVDCYKTKVVTKQIVPDVTAQIFWLKNRQPDKWRDVKEHKHEGEIVFSEKLKSARSRIKELTRLSNN